MFAPPGLDIFPVTKTELLVTVPLDNVNVGAGTVGAAVMLAEGPTPAEFAALTLKVWVPLDSPVKVCCNAVPTFIHELLLSCTSYLVIAAPPFEAGACQLILT